jgi:hypothetical protein
MRPYLLLFLIPFLLANIEETSLCAGVPKTETPRAGGPCEYHRYEGLAEVTSLRKTVDPYRQGKESWEVKFRFIPTVAIRESFAQTADREFLLEISQSSYLSREFIEQHGVQIGSAFHGYLLAITRGTCTPVLFEFPAFSSK